MTTNIAKDGAHIHRVNDFVNIDFGGYWEYAPVAVEGDEQSKSRLNNGSIYIINDVKCNVITDQIQTVCVYQTRLDGGGSYGSKVSFDIDDFTRDFKPVPMDEAERIRKSQLGILKDTTKQLETDIKLALSDPNELLRQIGISKDSDIAEGRGELHMGVALPSPEMMAAKGTNIISASDGSISVGQHKKQFENQAKLGKLANQLAKSKAGELSTTLAIASDLMMEGAEAIQGKANDMIRKVDGVMRKIGVMEFYLGEQVEIEVVRTGEPALHTQKFDLSSSMIYMDEEIATERIFADKESFDCRNISDFMKRLAVDDSLLNRITPSERCIITLRPSRDGKKYEDYHPKVADDLNRANQSSFLLVRDGGRVHAIHSKIDFKQHLFPTGNEMDSFFKHIYANSTVIVDKQREFERMATDYNGVIAILQGVKDRQDTGGDQVFGELPREGLGNSFLNEHYIKQNCHFINDEDNLLANQDLPEDISSWFHQNADYKNHAKGDIVVFNNNLLDHECISGAYKWHDRSGEYITDWSVPYSERGLRFDRVGMFRGEPILMVKLESYSGSTPIKNFRALVNKARGSILNIMELEPSVLDKVLQSRSARPSLHRCGFMSLLVEARELIVQIREETAELADSLKGYYPNFTDDQIHLMIMNWARTAKAGDAKPKEEFNIFRVSRDNPTLSHDEINQLRLDWLSNPPKADKGMFGSFTVKAATSKIVSEHNKSIAFGDTLINKAVAEIESSLDEGDKVIFASKHLGKLHLFVATDKHENKFKIPIKGIKHPMFRHYEFDTKCEMKDKGIICNEISHYPVSRELVDNLTEYDLNANRLSTKDWKAMANKANVRYADFLSLIELVDGAIKEPDVTLKMLAIIKLDGQMDLYSDDIRDTSGKVTLAIPFLPAVVSFGNHGNYIKGLGFHLQYALMAIYNSMTHADQRAHRREINEMMSDRLYFSGFIREYSQKGDGNFICYFEQKITGVFLAKLTMKQTSIYHSGYSISAEKDLMALVNLLKPNLSHAIRNSAFGIKES